VNCSGYKVLLVGCGQLGSWHLQALASLALISNIEVLDPDPQSLEMGKQRVRELHDDQIFEKIRWITALEDATSGGDLCVIAIQAKGRCQLMRSIADKLGYSSFILEKVVDQSVSAIENAISFCNEHEISCWVNFQTRVVPTYRRVKQKLGGTDPIYFSAMGGSQVLVSNAIHTADLFVYYDECASIDQVTSRIDQLLHPSKRGSDIYDLTGTIQGYTSKGSSLTLSYGQGESPWEHFSIASKNYRCVIDTMSGWMMESEPSSDWQWRPVTFEGTVLVSQTTKDIATDILTDGICKLPSIEESLISHRFLLNELLPHFSALTGSQLESCPVT
jgi:predicted dehydrogenase